MVSVICGLVTAAVVVSFASPSTGTTYSVPQGVYFKPSDGSGFANTTSWRRSPCPALNTLANFGFVERNGVDIPKSFLKNAIQTHFNVADDLISVMLSILPDFVTLNTLSRLEHQISLSRPPTYYGHDPAAVNTTLVKSLLLRAKNGFLDAEGVGKAYKARLTEYQSDPRFSVTDSHLTQAFTEGSFLLLIFGANRDDRISVEDARSFLVDEKFPDNWKPSPTPVTLGEARAIAKDIRGFAT